MSGGGAFRRFFVELGKKACQKARSMDEVDVLGKLKDLYELGRKMGLGKAKESPTDAANPSDENEKAPVPTMQENETPAKPPVPSEEKKKDERPLQERIDEAFPKGSTPEGFRARHGL